MYLGLLIACLYVIFRRSKNRRQMAGRMILLFVAVLVLTTTLLAFIPRYERALEPVAAIAAVAIPIIYGLMKTRVSPPSQSEPQGLSKA